MQVTQSRKLRWYQSCTFSSTISSVSRFWLRPPQNRSDNDSSSSSSDGSDSEGDEDVKEGGVKEGGGGGEGEETGGVVQSKQATLESQSTASSRQGTLNKATSTTGPYGSIPTALLDRSSELLFPYGESTALFLTQNIYFVSTLSRYASVCPLWRLRFEHRSHSD